MANTVIQFKRSTTTTAPTAGSLSAAEPAYSYLSGKLFVGSSTGAGIVEIGGSYWVDISNTAYATAQSAYAVANLAATQTFAGSIYDQANSAYGQANSAYNHANSVATAANAYATSVGTAGNTYADAVGTGSNAYATLVGSSSNAYADVVGTAANSYANSISFSTNAYAVFVGNAANAFASSIGVSSNAYADSVGAAANNWANTKLSSSGGTITGDLALVGNLTVSGNTSYINVQNYRVDDPLIYLAGNNYISDIVDIGFIGNYVNATGSNVHTGFFRNHEDKEYYLFSGYDQEPENNHIDVSGNNFTIAVLNAIIKTDNIALRGVNVESWITSAYNAANAAPGIANSYADAVGTAANSYTNAIAVAGNTYAATVGTAGNNYTDLVGISSNAYANSVGTAGNSYATSVGTAGNSYAVSVGTSANAYADAVGTAANTNAANASYLSTGTVPSGVISGSYTGITGVGTITTGIWNGSTIDVGYGGTGLTTVTTNGILYGNGSGALSITAAGTEGQVLQASAAGIPSFGMLDGGTF